MNTELAVRPLSAPAVTLDDAEGHAQRMLARLSPQQRLFAEAYASLGSPRAAWRQAGLPALEPHSKRAMKVAHLPEVRQAVEALQALDSVVAARRHSEVLSVAADAATFDPLVLLDEDGRSRRMDEIPVRFRRCVQRVEVTERTRTRGKAIVREVTTSYSLMDKPKALDMCLKAAGAYARDNAQQGLAVGAGIAEVMQALQVENAVEPGD